MRRKSVVLGTQLFETKIPKPNGKLSNGIFKNTCSAEMAFYADQGVRRCDSPYNFDRQ